jgi:large subunit ribosomal protein L10
MSKPVKELIARELAGRYVDQTNAVWVELVGADGITTNQFRRDLRAKRMRLEFVKTALFKRACISGPLSRLAKELNGPAALVTGGDSAIEVAKVLDAWLPKLQKNLRLRGAVLEGEYLDVDQVKGLSRMPSKTDLQARIVSLVLSPGANILAAALGPGRNVAGLLKALIEKLEKSAPSEEVTAAS